MDETSTILETVWLFKSPSLRMEVAPEIEMGIQIQTPGPLAAFSAKSKGTTKLTVLSLKADLTSEATDFKEKEDI